MSTATSTNEIQSDHAKQERAQGATDKLPVTATPLIAPIPDELKKLKQWVCWTYSQASTANRLCWSKVPIASDTGAAASVNRPESWSSFSAAMTGCIERGLDGIGFVLTRNDPYVGVDLDHCRGPATGVLADWASRILDRLATYAEVSPSGAGVKAIVRSEAEFAGRRSSRIEMYSHGRYFTLTGCVLRGYEAIRSAPDAVGDLYASLLKKVPFVADKASSSIEPPPLGVTDEVILEHARCTATDRSS